MSATRMPIAQQPPAWAELLIERVCAAHRRRVPPLRWRRRTQPWTSGALYYDGTGMSIVAGTDVRQLRMVLLHELAHYLVGPTHQHDERFWRRCWELYRRYGVDLAYAWQAETSYRKGAATFAPEAVRRRFDPPLRAS
jgi:hypothetical protein